MADENNPPRIAPASRDFLIELFVGLKEDLAQQAQAGGPGRPEPRKAAQSRAIYEALLFGLTNNVPFPDDEDLRGFVADLASATDEENDYERVTLEHQALEELSRAVSCPRPTCGSRSESSHG
jgi:hypothetical protein